MNIIFLSTPEFGIPALEKILESKHKLIAIISQPDKPQDRGNRIIFSPVKQFAITHNIPLYQFEKISREGVETIRNLKPDIMITASYGQIISQEIIDIPKYGIINIHASLLPKYRGASPIQFAILKGERTTGITIMQTEAGLDTGDIILTKETFIGDEETAGELSERLSFLGAESLFEALDLIESGNISYKRQSHIEATATTKISKDQGKIFWQRSAEQIKCQIHAYNPFPIAFSFLNNERVKIYRAKVSKNLTSTSEISGTVIDSSSVKSGLLVQCGQGILEILELQFPGGKIMSGIAALNGRKVKSGDCFKIDEEIQSVPIILKNKK